MGLCVGEGAQADQGSRDGEAQLAYTYYFRVANEAEREGARQSRLGNCLGSRDNILIGCGAGAAAYAAIKDMHRSMIPELLVDPFPSGEEQMERDTTRAGCVHTTRSFHPFNSRRKRIH